MPSISPRATFIVLILSLALYQTILRDILTKTGLGRVIQPITDFPYTCSRLSYPGFEACEDMWLDETNHELYLMCSSVAGRKGWVPALGKFDEKVAVLETERGVGGIWVLDVKGDVGAKALRKLKVDGDRTLGGIGLYGLSVSGRVVPGKGKGKGKVELFVVNTKPSVVGDGSGVGHRADNAKTGANSTIELFETEPGSSSVRHVRTFAHPDIVTPNNVAVVPDGSGFYTSNDHGIHRAGTKHSLSAYLFTGNVAYCTNPPLTSSTPPTCKVVATGLSMPNGLTIHPQDPKTLYVPSSGIGKGVSIFKIDQHTGGLTKITDLAVPYALDNLSPSSDGAIYAAAFPKIQKTLDHFEDAATYDPNIAITQRVSPPAAVLKINKLRNLVNDGREVTWSWEKVIEDAKGHQLPATTTAVKDVKSGRLFVSGLLSYFLTVCEPQ